MVAVRQLHPQWGNVGRQGNVSRTSWTIPKWRCWDGYKENKKRSQQKCYQYHPWKGTLCRYNKVLTCCQEAVDDVPWAGIRGGCVRVHATCACVRPRSPSYGTPPTVLPSVCPQDPFPRGTNTIIISDRLKCHQTIYVTWSLSCTQKQNNNNTWFSLAHTPKIQIKVLYNKNNHT